jgi:hypothetical protein
LSLEWYGHAVPADVRGQRLFRHRVLLEEELWCAIVLIAQGPPRSWQMALDAAEKGTRAALERRYSHASMLLTSAASEVTSWVGTVLDRNVGDVHGAAVSVHSGDRGLTAAVATVGSCRGYHHRRDDHQRLVCPQRPTTMVGTTAISAVTVPLGQDETFVLGPSHLFTGSGGVQLVRCLYEDQAPPVALAQGLLTTSEAERNGGAVVALRT